MVSQTGAIARYCGKLGGFYPKDDDFAAAKIDEIIDTATDITNVIGATMRMTDDKEKLAARAAIAADKLPMYFAALEKMLEANGSTGNFKCSSIFILNWFIMKIISGFFVGKSMTIADIAMWRLLGWIKCGVLDGIPKDIIDKYPLLLKGFNDMDAHPEIRAWMDSRYPKKWILSFWYESIDFAIEIKKHLHENTVSIHFTATISNHAVHNIWEHVWRAAVNEFKWNLETSDVS